MSDAFPSRLLDKFVLRLPAGLRERVGKAAKENGRSMNAEIVARLEETFKTDLTSKAAAAKILRMIPNQGDPLEDRVAVLERIIQKMHPEKRAKKRLP